MQVDRPSVSVVVPCRNEMDFIDACLHDLTTQDLPPIEILIAEGASTDQTREKLSAWQARDLRVKVIDNPGGLIPAGLNLAVMAAKGTIIVRADVHTRYGANYISECVKALTETGAANVGGPWLARGTGVVQRAIACAFQSSFSCGGARSHSATYEGPVDSVYLGCWSREALLKLGLYDEEFLRSEDDELNLRITRSGALIWQTPRIQSWYLPRSSLAGLFSQYYQWGYWKVRVIQKHQLPASWRHVVPGLVLAVGSVLTLIAPFHDAASYAVGIGVAAYAALAIGASVAACRQQHNWRSLLLLPAVFPVFHVAYGAGFLKGVVDFVILRRQPRSGMTKVTR